MQTNWYILIFLFMVSACQSGKQKQAEIRSIDLLQESYTAKDENTFVYVCKVNQNIDLSDKKQGYKLKRMPDENVRNSLCTTEKM